MDATTTDLLRDWAHEHGLRFAPEGLLPPATESLRRGLGAGAHRAGLLRVCTPALTVTTGGLTRRPERATHHLCDGTLPGGVDGRLGHHVHLELRDGESWTAVPETVVLAVVPGAGRVLRTGLVHRRPAPAAPRALLMFGRIDVVPAPTPAVPPGCVDVFGWRWRTTGAADLAALAEPAIAAALDAAPEGTTVEVCDGALAVVSPGALSAAGQLDALCRVAAVVADTLRRAAADCPELDADVSLRPAPPLTHPGHLGREHADSLAGARSAVADAAERAAAGTRPVRRAGLAAARVLLGGLLLDAVLTLAFGVPAGLGVAGAVLGGLLVAPRWLLVAVRDGRRDHARPAARHRDEWGLDAFTAAYAQSRGVLLEDPDALRVRCSLPLAGVPLDEAAVRGATPLALAA